MAGKTVNVWNIDIRELKPYIPLLQKYIGLPFPELEMACVAAETETNPEAEHSFSLIERTSPKTITKLLQKYFNDVARPVDESKIVFFLWLAANIYHPGSIAEQESADIEFAFNQIEEMYVYEEIAQLYSYIQKRKSLHVCGDTVYGVPGKPIEFVSDGKVSLKIHNSCCWFEALLENYLFPNCLPDVASDEDAQRIWKKERKKVGRKSRTETNAIIHGVDLFLHDEGLVDSVAPTNLCEFLFDYLDAMGYLSDPTDRLSLAPSSIKAYIHNLRKETASPQFGNVVFKQVSIEELSRTTPEEDAYFWLFHPKHDKKETEE